MSDSACKLQASIEEQTELEFELQMQGVDTDDIDIILYIDHPEHIVGFRCQHIKDDEWSVTIPALDGIVPSGTHDYHICVYVDGYYFTPVEGSMFVMAEKPRVALKTKSDQQREPELVFKNKDKDEQQDQRNNNRQDKKANALGGDNENNPPKKEKKEKSKQVEEKHEESHRRSFFSKGSPHELAEQIRNMPSGNYNSNTEKVVKRILREHKK